MQFFCKMIHNFIEFKNTTNMKKYLFLCLSLILMFFVACEKIEKQESVNVDTMVAQELEKLDNGYSDETLKAMAVIIRTNLIVDGETKINKMQPNEKYLLLTKSTDYKQLKNKNGSLVKISFEDSPDYTWQKNIKKSDILEFALKNNVSLTSLSNIEPVMENKKIIALKIGNKSFDYNTLAEHFGLESNIIEKISTNSTEIIIKGKNKGFNNSFDIETSEQLSNNNHNYLEILNIIFSDFSAC